MRQQLLQLLREGWVESRIARSGTPGLGKGSFASLECCTILNCHVAPAAEITFPHREAGKEPLRARVSLADD